MNAEAPHLASTALKRNSLSNSLSCTPGVQPGVRNDSVHVLGFNSGNLTGKARTARQGKAAVNAIDALCTTVTRRGSVYNIGTSTLTKITGPGFGVHRL